MLCDVSCWVSLCITLKCIPRPVLAGRSVVSTPVHLSDGLTAYHGHLPEYINMHVALHRHAWDARGRLPTVEAFFFKRTPDETKVVYQLDLDLDFLSFSEEIVSDGDKPMPCNPSTPETAPMGAYLCDANTSICLEKWTVSVILMRAIICKSSPPCLRFCS